MEVYKTLLHYEALLASKARLVPKVHLAPKVPRAYKEHQVGWALLGRSVRKAQQGQKEIQAHLSRPLLSAQAQDRSVVVEVEDGSHQ